MEKRIASLFVIAGIAISSTVSAQSTDLTTVRLALNWFRTAQNAPIMAADLLGYFKEEGIKLELIDGGPGKNPVTTVGAGQADFGINGSTFVFLARLAPQPVDIVAVGAIYQQATYAYLTLGNPGDPDPTPKDMAGKTIGIQSDGDVFLKAISAKNNVDISTMNVKTVQGTADPLLLGQVDFISVQLVNQPYQVEMEAAKPDAPKNLKGKTWKAVRFSKYGVNSYQDVIFTTGKTVKERPDLVRRFLRAVGRGLKLTQDDPAQVVKLAATYPGQLDSLDKLKWRMPIHNQLVLSTDTTKNGFLWMNPDVWATQMAFYREIGQIPRVVAPTELMTNEFNPGIKSN